MQKYKNTERQKDFQTRMMMSSGFRGFESAVTFIHNRFQVTWFEQAPLVA
jgi:hypothetical protein